MKKIKIDPDKYSEYLKTYYKAKTNRYFNANTKQYRYIHIVKTTLYSMNVLCSTIEAYIICSEYFGDPDPKKWVVGIFGLDNELEMLEFINARPFLIEIVDKGESQTS